MTLEEQIARLAHRGQTDKAGVPYIEHVERVVEKLEGDARAQQVAWLHDVVEDTPFTAELLLKLGVHPSVVKDVRVLTRQFPYHYDAYIDSVIQYEAMTAPHTKVLKVKLADVHDHLHNPNPIPALVGKYTAAWEKLVKARV